MAGPALLPRTLLPVLEEALRHSRITALLGARQTGKTTLARALAAGRGGTYRSLDDREQLEAARTDPTGFLEARAPLVIDEFQRAGDDLLRALKRKVDEDPRPGRFLITGSARYTTVPRISESLAGRVEILELGPLSQGELTGTRERFLERLFGPTEALRSLRPPVATRRDVFERICRGGYPGARRLEARARSRWFASHVRTVTERDVLDLRHVRRIVQVRRLLSAIAARTAQALNVHSISGDLGTAWDTVSEHLALLESLYVVHELPAWSTNLTARVAKHAKGYVSDSGLCAHLLRVDPTALSEPTCRATGALLETFVVGELVKQSGWSATEVLLNHFRDHLGHEVDVLLETPDGRVAGVEVKASASVGRSDFRGLDLLHERLGKRFVNGVVLYLGDAVLPFGDRRTLLPLSALWTG